jgi:hypothetical protein
VTEGQDLDHARAIAKDADRSYVDGLKKAKEPIPVEREDFSHRAGRAPKPPPLQKAQGWGTRKFKGWRTRQY